MLDGSSRAPQAISSFGRTAARPAARSTAAIPVMGQTLVRWRPTLLFWRGCRCPYFDGLQYRTEARRLVSARITPLRLEAFEQLPKHARRCVFWEVDPATLGNQDHLADPEFEKEAWLSMVMLEWGSCGQVATAVPDDERSHAEQPCLGYVLYAPPRAVPRAQRFPTAPVSADAVLLTSMNVEPGPGTEDLPRGLIARVIDELMRRGVRALEAFGRTPAASELQDPRMVDPDVRPVLEALGDCSVDHCMIDAEFLKDVGFVVVAPHPYFPRLRLELDKGLGWKAEVEAALERLLANAQLEQPGWGGGGGWRRAMRCG